MNGYIMLCTKTNRVELVIAKTAYIARRIAHRQHKMDPMRLAIWKTINKEPWRAAA